MDSITIIDAVITLLMAGILGGLILLVKTFGKETVDDAFNYAQIIVIAVHQIAKRKGWTNKLKLEEAIKRLRKQFPNLSEQELEDLIEAAYGSSIKGFDIIKEEYAKME